MSVELRGKTDPPSKALRSFVQTELGTRKAKRGEKVYNHAGRAGCVSLTKSSKTGTLVGVYHGIQSGLETGEPNEHWTTVCEVHHTCSSHSALKDAQRHATDPTGWCEACSETHAV